jgi:T5SS/PEP-CTERM-associated repeat protein
MMRILFAIGTIVMLSMAPVRAATYQWDGGPTGNFSDPNWLNAQTLERGGPPGAGDIAQDDEGGTLTLQGGSVQELEGNGTFDVEGQFSCTLLDGGPTVIGFGQLTSSTVKGIVFLKGGNLVANVVMTSQIYVQAGGTLLAQLVTDHANVTCADPGSSINAQGGMADVGLQVMAGGHVTAASIDNGQGSSSSVQGSGALVSVSGDVTLAEGSTLDLSSGAKLQASGNLFLAGGATFTSGGASLTDPQTSLEVGGNLMVGAFAGSFFFSVKNGAHLLGNTTFIGTGGNGHLSIDSGGSVVAGGKDHNFVVGAFPGSSGFVSVADPNSSLDIGAWGTLCAVGSYGVGTLSISDGASVHCDILALGLAPGSTGALTITGTGSSLYGNNNLFVGGTPLEQPGGSGSVLVTDSAKLQVGPLLWISKSGVVTLDSTAQISVGQGAFGPPGTLRVNPGGTLFGYGRVQGQVVQAQGGKIIPGGSPGILTIDGNFQQEPGAELDIVIGGNTPGSGFSQLNVTGAASIGGTLNIILANGFTPSPGETFPILNAASVSGTFAQVNGASVSYTTGGITLNNVTGTTAPPIVSIETQGQNILVSWPEAAQGYSLQTTPNLLSPTWTTIPTIKNTFVSDPAVGPAFFRLVQAPVLAIQRSPSNMLVTWWPHFPGFGLQSTINPSSGPWINVLTSTNSYAFNPNGPAMFFRLIH